MRFLSRPIRAGPSATSGVLSASEREQLRHPLERKTTFVVGLLAFTLVTLTVSFLVYETEWLADFPDVGKYKSQARILLVAILAAPLVATYARKRRRLLAQEESIRVTATQLPEIYDVLVSHCRRVGISVPDLYLSDGLEHTTAFRWRGHDCIVLATHDFELFPHARDEVVEFALAREVGSICLGHTSFKKELLKSLVATIPFLRGPLHQVCTYSRDRYGAYLAPRATRALLVPASSDQLLNRVDVDAYFADVDANVEDDIWARIIWLFMKRVPLAHRVLQLRRAGMLSSSR
jgi:hypothetical protein